MANKFERRFVCAELRAEGDGEGRKLVGYAAKFGASSSDLGGFTEIIRKGAFAKTIQEADVRALWNHDDNFVLGRTKSGTLRLSEDEIGLRVEIDPPDTQYARDLMTSIDRGDVDQMSFAFRAIKDEWTHDGDQHTRELIEVQLYDVSPVTYPAYEDTVITLRSLDRALLTPEDLSALESLEAPTRSEEPPPAGHSITDVMRRRLDLAERL